MLALVMVRRQVPGVFLDAMCEGDGGPADSDGLTRGEAHSHNGNRVLTHAISLLTSRAP
jgi:hypothetical protein